MPRGVDVARVLLLGLDRGLDVERLRQCRGGQEGLRVGLCHPQLSGSGLVNVADTLETRQFEEKLLVFPLQLLSAVFEMSEVVS